MFHDGGTPRDDRKRKKRGDDRWETLKRRVQMLARVDGHAVLLDDGAARKAWISNTRPLKKRRSSSIERG